MQPTRKCLSKDSPLPLRLSIKWLCTARASTPYYHLKIQKLRIKARCTDKYDDSTRNYTQTVLVNGKLFPRCLPAMAMPKAGGSAVECAETNCGTVPAHCKLEFQIFKVLIAWRLTYFLAFASMDHHRNHSRCRRSDLYRYLVWGFRGYWEHDNHRRWKNLDCKYH